MQMSKAKLERRALPKRFYAAVDVQQSEGGFLILLDGKTVKTAAKKLLQVSSQQLAEAIATEWRAQTDVIDTDTMPLTRLTNIALDRLETDRLALLEQITAYAETDLICYHDTQPELRVRQQHHFDPILQWLKATYHIEVQVTDGVMPIIQSTTSLASVREVFAEANNNELAALAMMVPLLGSTYLTLAVWKRHIAIEEAIAAAHLDEAFHVEQWGEDTEMVTAWASRMRDIRAVAMYLLANE
jgi:chaperone required for assembly of F1-ATPase